jgi:type IV secretory pathway VirB2 component (pilin)
MRSAFRNISLCASAAAINMMMGVQAFAQSFAGPIPSIPGTPDSAGDPRNAIIQIVRYVLNFLALIAVIVIIIAGIRLILSQGEEEPKEKAKKTILYAIIGLIIVLFARVIVALITEELPANL